MAIRQLVREDAADAARLHRASFEERLPWLAGLHTPEEDRAFYENVVFDECEVWGAFEGDVLIAFVAFRQDWIDQFYVLPEHQGRGVGSALLAIAQSRFPRLQLWTFQKNAAARRFYEGRGFRVAEESDGLRNEEREPDMRYVWQRDRQ